MRLVSGGDEAAQEKGGPRWTCLRRANRLGRERSRAQSQVLATTSLEISQSVPKKKEAQAPRSVEFNRRDAKFREQWTGTGLELYHKSLLKARGTSVKFNKKNVSREGTEILDSLFRRERENLLFKISDTVGSQKEFWFNLVAASFRCGAPPTAIANDRLHACVSWSTGSHFLFSTAIV